MSRAAAIDAQRLAVIVVDDVELARRRNVVALEEDDGLEVVAQGDDLLSVLPDLGATEVDVAVVALSQGGVASPGTIEVARAAMPGASMVVLVSPRDRSALDALDPTSVAGVVPRTEALERLAPAVRAAWGGRASGSR